MRNVVQLASVCVSLLGVALVSGCAGNNQSTEAAEPPEAQGVIDPAFTAVNQPASGTLLAELRSAPHPGPTEGMCAAVMVDAQTGETTDVSGDCDGYPVVADIPVVVGSLRMRVEPPGEMLYVTFTDGKGRSCSGIVIRDGDELRDPPGCDDWANKAGEPPEACARMCLTYLRAAPFLDQGFVYGLVPEEATTIEIKRDAGDWVTYALNGPRPTAFTGFRLFMAHMQSGPYFLTSIARKGETAIAGTGETCLSRPALCDP